MKFTFVPLAKNAPVTLVNRAGQPVAISSETTLGPDYTDQTAFEAAMGLCAPEVYAARKPKLSALSEKLRKDLLAIFATWTVGEQYDFDGARIALNADLEAGNLTRAIQGVSTFRVTDVTITDHRNAVLSVLNAAAVKFQALAAAVTVDAVNATA